MLSSDHVLQLGEVPARVAVVGGGAIGCEFASFLVDVGAEVTILEVLPQILTGVDQQVAQTVVRAFTKRGMKVRAGVKVIGVDRGAHECSIRFEGKDGPEALTVDQVVVSVGRRPRSDDIGLEAAQVKVDERGFVVVDGNMRTSVEGVYAVGDVVSDAAARARRVRGSDRRDQDNARRRSGAARIRQGPVGNLLPSRSGILRADRGTGEASRATTSSPPCTGGWGTAGR